MGMARRQQSTEHRAIDPTEKALYGVNDMVHRTHGELPDQAIETLKEASKLMDTITRKAQGESAHQERIDELTQLIERRQKEMLAVKDIFDSLEEYVAQASEAIYKYAKETDPERKITLYEHALRERRYLQADLAQIESSSPASLSSERVQNVHKQLREWGSVFSMKMLVPEESFSEPSIDQAYDGHFIFETETEEVPEQPETELQELSEDDIHTEEIPVVRVPAKEKAKTVNQIIAQEFAKKTQQRANDIGLFGRTARYFAMLAAMFTLSGETNREIENQPPAPEAASLSSEYTESVDDISEETSDDETATTLDTAQETLDTADAPTEIVPQPTTPTEDEMKRGIIQSGEGLSHALERFTSRADMIQAVNTLELTIDGTPRKLRDVFVKAAGDQIRLSVDQDDSGKITALHVYDTATGQEITGPDLDRVLSYVPFEKDTNADEEPTVLIQSTG